MNTGTVTVGILAVALQPAISEVLRSGEGQNSALH